ncbi:ABC transporter ATP-binding protein [Natronobacterium gregoryi]|uniref:Molybdate/tungstate import ATP-binding protein WtpC n=2 Tax=Natronobacterium gregoryi TaxID=44930 RepID=L0AKX5_NATGS|nr:ABC transporter ATP-binding protein [Natronobacterium gregoryi]AFZ73690.1 ABC-type spermidine/putrescine transport system, ATPase component [Natronobacterium gregoryi SP2]ELY67651.1 ABC transporter [Natronobacterium gregoryi SP2]PLK19560.1 ABC transporter ATP-binding protein [Natronobacterium gregoryi SP2]SFJ01286.1 spermidine/putrescine transport system ATP-binding protein [Natronobacterium gregoryi]
MSEITLQGLEKQYGETTAVEDVSVEIADGELLCLLGPSGSGKSTTLRMIAGLETPTAGSIRIDDEDVTDQPAYDRNTSTVFQDWALFPHKTVRENVAFGLKMRGVSREERTERAEEMLERVQMGGYGDDDPTNLSGGQKQRVALARSLAVNPDVLLLDEPLSNLDKRLREDMQIELREIHEDLEETFVHVTHDQDEAFTLADRIGIMNEGQLIQVGDPDEIYENPRNRFIEGFLGDTNFVDGTVGSVGPDSVAVETKFDSEITIPADTAHDLDEGTELTLSLRPEIFSIERPTADDSQRQVLADGAAANAVVGTIDNVLYRGSTVRYSVSAGDTSIFVERTDTTEESLAVGDEIRIEWNGSDVLAFRTDGTRIPL